MQSYQPGRLPFLFHQVISCAIQGQICWGLLRSVSLEPRDVPPGLELRVVPWRSCRRINKDLSAGPTQPMNTPEPVLSREITKNLKILNIADV